MTTREFNFDGLIGPTHNYAGLSYGNVASTSNKLKPSNPRAAALQGLEKMKTVHELGVGQAVLPPLRRPRFEFLRQLGFTGSDRQILESAARTNPMLLVNVYSASNMWTANAATVSPSLDCSDGQLHITPANLSNTLHRSIEHPSTTRNLREIFSDENQFTVHAPLPSQPSLSDEGAANHTRLCASHGGPGIELFVFGAGRTSEPKPTKFPARQTRLASESVAFRHKVLNAKFLQQSPAAIDAGVFHNDVISVGNENVLLCYERSFVNQPEQLKELQSAFESEFNTRLFVVEFKEEEISLSDVVSSYLFNSQLVTRPDGKMTLICPTECEENASAQRCTQRLLSENNPIDQVKFLDLKQSMNNGGGPACLRLRVVLDEAQQAAVHQGVLFSNKLHEQLCDWVNKHYRDELSADDLRDPKLIDESYQAIEQLADILELPSNVLLDL